jgi:hypothetical protein
MEGMMIIAYSEGFGFYLIDEQGTPLYARTFATYEEAESYMMGVK